VTGVDLSCGDVCRILDAESDYSPLMLLAHLHHPLVIGIEHRNSVRLQTLDQFGLGGSNIFHASQMFKMHRRHH
jgi:hypothetical protein